MLATNRELTDGDRWAIEPKLDGWRVVVYVESTTAHMAAASWLHRGTNPRE